MYLSLETTYHRHYWPFELHELQFGIEIVLSCEC
jgi:hypothetical protein